MVSALFSVTPTFCSSKHKSYKPTAKHRHTSNTTAMLRQLVCLLSLLASLSFPTASSAYAPWMRDEWKLDHAINEESIQTQQPIKEVSHPAGDLIHPHTHPHVKSSEYFNKEALYRLNVVPCRVYIPPPG